MGVDPSCEDLCSHKKRYRVASFSISLFLSLHHEKKSGRWPPPEPDHAGILILNLKPPELVPILGPLISDLEQRQPQLARNSGQGTMESGLPDLLATNQMASFLLPMTRCGRS
ncbi:uncharacterized protein LOC144615810 [Panthera onca]